MALLPPAPTRRRLAVLTAARAPLTRLAAPEVPWPERLVICALDGGPEVINLHSPIAPAPELAKIRTHEALAAHLGALEPAPRVLCGDLNTPRREFEGGDVLTFAHDTNGRLRPERGERWNRAERALIRDLGWTDAFRALHGYEHREALLDVLRRSRRLAPGPRPTVRRSSRSRRPTPTTGAGPGSVIIHR